MNIYCLEDFKVQFEKVKRKSTYKSIEKDILDYFFIEGKTINSFCEGTRLNASAETPYIKKRLKGSGGWRFYYLAIIKDDCIYLLFFHPKTGSLGAENIADDFKASIYKKVLSCIKSRDLYEIEKDKETDNLIFKYLSDKKTSSGTIDYVTVSKKNKDI